MPRTPKPRKAASEAVIADKDFVDEHGSPLLTPPGQPPRGKKLRSGRKEPISTTAKKRAKRGREPDPIKEDEEGGKKQKKTPTVNDRESSKNNKDRKEDDAEMQDRDQDDKKLSTKEDTNMEDAEEKKTDTLVPMNVEIQSDAVIRTNGSEKLIETQAQMKVQVQQPPANDINIHTTTSSNQSSNGVPPIQNLKLPCDKTPGKRIIETKPIDKTPYHRSEKILHSAKAPPTLGRIMAESQNMPQRTVEASLSPDVATNRILFNDSQVVDIVEESFMDDNDQKAEMLENPLLWCLAFFVLYFFNAYRIEELSTSSVYYYKDLMGVPPLIETNITEIPKYITPDPIIQQKIVEKLVPSTKPPESVIVENELSNDLDATLREFSSKSFDILGNTYDACGEELHKISAQINAKKIRLEEWAGAVDQAERLLDDALNGQELSHTDILSVIQQVSSVGRDTISSDLVSTSGVPLWKIMSPLGCPEPDPIKITDIAVNENAILERDDALRSFALSLVSHAKTDKSVSIKVAEYVKNEMANTVGEEDEVAIVQPTTHELEKGITKEMADAVIYERLEHDYADETGAVDFASVTNGAQVITTGGRATSPSLKDTLPVMNRLMHNAKIRFYGHGPEAALTPSIPWDALGQCWSFEDASKSKISMVREQHRMDRVNGRFATLSISLSQPIEIGSIVIDHNGQTGSAIRNFRVSGFTNPNASGRPIDLGSYQFDRSANARSQTFKIENQDVPRIESITLAVDTIYGKNYGCLYRVRVLTAKETKLEKEEGYKDY